MSAVARTEAYRSIYDPKFDLSCYHFSEVSSNNEDEFVSIVDRTYGPLGFLNEHSKKFLPRHGTRRYLIRFLDQTLGSFAITPVLGPNSVYHSHIGYQRPDGGALAMAELNNIILAPQLRGGIGLALILYNAAQIAVSELRAEMVVGVTRYQTLRYFVEAGATPLCHEPLHVLGKNDINDFIIYYDLTSPNAHIYLHERAKRIFAQTAILRRIREIVHSDADVVSEETIDVAHPAPPKAGRHIPVVVTSAEEGSR